MCEIIKPKYKSITNTNINIEQGRSFDKQIYHGKSLYTVLGMKESNVK